MSSHHSQKSINLHHEQVAAGRDRGLRRQANRVQNFLVMRSRLRFEYNFTLVCGFVLFAYTTLATALYTGRIIWA